MGLNTKHIWKSFPCYGVLALVLSLILFEWLRGVPVPPCFPSDLQALRDEVIGLVLSKTSQGVAVGTLFFYHLLLLWMNARGRSQNVGLKLLWWRTLDFQDGCKLFLVLCAVAQYMAEWKALPAFGDRSLLLFGVDQNTNVLVFLTGIVFGQFVEVMVPRNDQLRLTLERICLTSLAAFLAVASLTQNQWSNQFKYRDGIRATGLWNNPNTYGLLMGIGLVLALAYLTRGTGLARRNQAGKPPDKDGRLRGGDGELGKKRLTSLISMGVAGVVTLLLVAGLIRSFSRGAWLATLAGCAFVFYSVRRTDKGRKPANGFGLKMMAGLACLRREKWMLIIAGCSVMALFLICRPQMEHRLTRRATSVANANDFSWRYRFIACKGALQIMADHPMAGIGWQRVGPEFEFFYAPPIVTDRWSIILNDYLTTGMALGIPALACFIGLVWVSWNGAARAHNHNDWGSPSRHLAQKAGHHESCSKSWLGQAYRAALIVLLIGFWFDGGLFRLALATPFWLFLELSNSTTNEGV